MTVLNDQAQISKEINNEVESDNVNLNEDKIATFKI